MTRLLACCVAAAVAVPACERGGEARQRLVVASVRQPATALLFVAQGAGCLARERVEIDERPFELGRDALALLRDGRADVAIAYETPLLRAALADDRLRVLTKLHTSTRNTRLVTLAASGIRAFSDLGGKRVGLARGTNAEFFAEVALGFGGVARESIALVDLAPPDAVRALERGEVDAAVLSDPYAGEAERLLAERGRTLLTDLYVEASLLLTRADVLAERAPALRAVLRGLACAERYARARGDEARALVAPRFPEQTPDALAAQLARVRWGIGVDNVLVDLLRRERDWLVASAPDAAAPDLGALVDLRLLEEVDPESVTLLPGAGGLRR